MTLQNIVAYCNLLQDISAQQECDDALRKLESVLYTVTNHAVQSQDLAQQLQHKYDAIQQNFSDFDTLIKTIKTNLMQVLIANDQRCVDLDLARYESERHNDDVGTIMSRMVNVMPGTTEAISTRLRLLNDWRLPGLIVRPAQETFLDPMVTFDPLYLLDQNQQYLEPFMQKFPEGYQRRLRCYEINEDQPALLSMLPAQQFGLIVMYNFLNYKPLPLMLRYVTEAFDLLRPGGTLIMTFNDCDLPQNMGLCEKNFMMYQPWRLVEPAILAAGYDIKQLHRPGGDIVWAELGRPGKISSLRGNAPLAKIVAN